MSGYDERQDVILEGRPSRDLLAEKTRGEEMTTVRDGSLMKAYGLQRTTEERNDARNTEDTWRSCTNETHPARMVAFDTVDSVADWASLLLRPTEQTSPQSPRGSCLQRMGASPHMSFAIAAGVDEEHYRALMSSCTSMAVPPQPSRPPWWEGTFGTAYRIAAVVKKTRVSIEEESKAFTGRRFEMVKLEVQQARAAGPRNSSTSIEEGAFLDREAASTSAVVGSRVNWRLCLTKRMMKRSESVTTGEVTREFLAGRQFHCARTGPQFADVVISSTSSNRIQHRVELTWALEMFLTDGADWSWSLRRVEIVAFSLSHCTSGTVSIGVCGSNFSTSHTVIANHSHCTHQSLQTLCFHDWIHGHLHAQRFHVHVRRELRGACICLICQIWI